MLLTRATLDDLYRAEGKAELIDGQLVELPMNGVRPSEVASNIYVSLRAHVKHTGVGRAFNDNLGYAVAPLPSGRESFGPDASYYNGPLPRNAMRFVEGAPTFAAEVRSEGDYGDATERALAQKRDEYFQAGTAVVWDVDPVNEVIDCYRATAPTVPVRHARGAIADAEPAVPGWRVAVDEVFA